MKVEERLLQKITAEYDTQIKAIKLSPGIHIDVLTVKDVDVLLDKIDPETFEKDERMPYWAELWPASIALGRYLLAHPIMEGTQILELGCGFLPCETFNGKV